MFNAISETIKAKLWEHQRLAIDFAIEHLENFDSPCLIRMPTGTGKTGIIACLTGLSNQGNSLVLTPWAHLRNQMVADLAHAFWDKIQVAPPKNAGAPLGAKFVEAMFPSTADKLLNSHDWKVLVTTFATINDLRINYQSTYEAIENRISLVVVDEGHYEPAVQWGRSVKGLKKKTVLLTATPYRNDLKLFRITDPSTSTHHFTHKDAVNRRIIRELQFQELNSKTNIPSLVKSFVQFWKAATINKSLPSTSPRTIICCSSHQDIETAVIKLRKARLNAIGIHEQFKSSINPHLVRHVPDPKDTDANIWVHQHKLTEGLDDNRFCCIALFTRIRNDRKLIQQIGRILRLDKNDRKKPAILLAPNEYSAQSEWEAYLEFEPQLRLLDPQHFRDVVNTLLKVQPAVEYFEGKFRRRFQPDNLDSAPQVIIPPSVLVRTADRGFSLEEYIEDCTDTLNTEDGVILGPDLNAPCQRSNTYALWVYASVRNSRFLQSTSLYEIKLETHCVVVSGRYVFMADSRGIFPTEYIEEKTMPLSADDLARFLSTEFRPTHVSVDSSIPYDTVHRGADLRGHNLLNIPASLTDRVQICRTARGVAKDLGRRYVGLINGRLRKEVSEEERRLFDLEQFVAWANEITSILNSHSESSALFRRYMPTCTPPTNPVPRTVSLDLLRLDVTVTLADETECSFRSSSSDILEHPTAHETQYICRFDLEISEEKATYVSLGVKYQPSKRRFWFQKHEGDSIHIHVKDDDVATTKTLVDFLNQRQDIILIGMEGGEIVYQGRNFYKIDYSHAEKALLDLIIRPASAPICRTEKGNQNQIAQLKKSKGKSFPDGSLFRAIAEDQIDLPFHAELLICDDLGTECADFVAANFQGNHLAMIHAKTGTGTKISASAFHDVVAQAMKNLVYLTPGTAVPNSVNDWTTKSRWNKTQVPTLCRKPLGSVIGPDLWAKLKSNIIDTANPQLYVVLVTSGCCNLQELSQAIADPTKRTPETAQLLHLLDGLNGYARQLGVRLIVRDLPYL